MARNNREAIYTLGKTFFITEEMANKIKELAKEWDRSEAYVIRTALEQFFETQKIN